ncbi:MAG: hypothetical protein D6775_09285, partial [Caldilineae bacterium]
MIMFIKTHFKFWQAIMVLGLLLGTLASTVATNAAASADLAEPRRRAQTQPQPTAIDPGEWNQYGISAAADRNGGLYAAWSDDRDGAQRLRYSFKPATGTWQPSALLDPGGSGGQYRVQLAADGNDNLYAVWADERGSVRQIYFATRPAGGDWSAGVPISATVQAQGVASLAVNKRGEVIVGWTLGEAGKYQVIASVRSASGIWSAPEQVTPTAVRIRDISVAIDDWGRIYLAWGIIRWGDSHPYQGFFTTRPAAGPWGAIEPVCVDCSPKIAVDNTGNVHAVWSWGGGSSKGVWSAYRPAGGPWSTPAPLDNAPNVDQVAISVDQGGNAVALWYNWDTGDVYRSIRYVGHGWNEKELVYTVASTSESATRDGASVSPMANTPAQSMSFSPGFVNLPTDFTFFPPMPSPGGGNENLGSLELPPPGQSGPCGGWFTAQANAALSNLGPAQGGGGAPCVNGPQPPAGNVDGGGFIGPVEPPENNYVIVKREIDGQVVYVVVTKNGKRHGIFSDPEDAKRFAQFPPHRLWPPDDNTLEKLLESPTGGAPQQPKQPKRKAIAMPPAPPEPQPPAPPEPKTGNGPPPVPPWQRELWDADDALSKIE